jgi:hypothetical protein
VAGELFLVAVGWILHHEISHVRLEHHEVQADPSIKLERDADLEAVDRVMVACEIPAERNKRKLGIVVAILAIQYLEQPIDEEASMRTHPKSIDRLDYCLTRMRAEDDSFACCLAVVGLQYHGAKSGITGPLEGASFRDILAGYQVAYLTHGRSSPR